MLATDLKGGEVLCRGYAEAVDALGVGPSPIERSTDEARAPLAHTHSTSADSVFHTNYAIHRKLTVVEGAAKPDNRS